MMATGRLQNTEPESSMEPCCQADKESKSFSFSLLGGEFDTLTHRIWICRSGVTRSGYDPTLNENDFFIRLLPL